MTGAVEALKRTRRTDDATVVALEDLAASAAPLSAAGLDGRSGQPTPAGAQWRIARLSWCLPLRRRASLKGASAGQAETGLTSETAAFDVERSAHSLTLNSKTV
jgi:hypothetical protein